MEKGGRDYFTCNVVVFLHAARLVGRRVVEPHGGEVEQALRHRVGSRDALINVGGRVPVGPREEVEGELHRPEQLPEARVPAPRERQIKQKTNTTRSAPIPW